MKLAILLVIATSLSACAGTVNREITEANKDPSFQYDGNYTGVVKDKGGQQLIDNWRFNCSAQDFGFQFSISESVVSIRGPDTEELYKSFVDKDGRFRLPIPTGQEARASGNSDASIQQGGITAILQGELKGDQAKGFIVFGIKQFQNRGCTYRTTFTKT